MRGRCLIVALVAALAASVPAAHAAGPAPGSPEYIQRDNQNMADAYGRQTAPDGQLNNPRYTLALRQEHNDVYLQQLIAQAAVPGRPALTPGNVFPGWNGGNPFRRGWNGSRGQSTPIAFTNRYGALLRGTVYSPLPGAKDPYSGRELEGPYPGVVITTGSVQGSERMYTWLAQDLAERGYVVITYDVQGQGTSETAPHENDQVNAVPFCNPFAEPKDKEQFGCPGVPAQQQANFVFGTQDALSFFLSTPSKRYVNRNAGGAEVNGFNPYWKLFDRSPDRRSETPGRTTRVGIVGHSLGASAISYVQGVDKRVMAAVALDKLSGNDEEGIPQDEKISPVVPALGIQSEYGFNVAPYTMSHGSSIAGTPGPPSEGPDPRRERKTGFETWRRSGVDSMMIVPRASTHLEYTDIAYALPASRYGQAFSSVYTQAWLDRYLKHASAQPLLATSFRYIEPVDVGKWQPITLSRARNLSFYYCSAYALRDRRTGALMGNGDIAKVGGCPPIASQRTGCLNATGRVAGQQLGAARLGRSRARQRAVLKGKLLSRRGGMDRYCVAGGGAMRIGYPTRRLRRAFPGRPALVRRSRALIALTSSRRYRLRGLGVSQSAKGLRRALKGERRVRVGRNVWYLAKGKRSRLLFQVRGGKIRQLGIAERRLSTSRAARKRFLRGWQLR